MARTASVSRLKNTVIKMRAEREKLARRLAEIDSFFAILGASAGTAPAAAPAPAAPARTGARRGRPPGSGRRRKRGSFAQTGEASVLAFVKSHGKPTAAEVNKHWQGEKRGGKADNALSKLVKLGQLKRIEAKGGERGGRYVLA